MPHCWAQAFPMDGIGRLGHDPPRGPSAPINVPTARAQAFPMDGIGRLGHDPPRGPSAVWWVLTTADAAGTNGLTCLPKHGGARDMLSRGLPSTFESVEASVVECPDLTQPEYDLTSPGLCGDPKLVEIGGPPYLLPLVQRDKLYELRALLQHQRRDPALLAGAGAGPWPHTGVNCEGIVNLSVRNGSVDQGTRVVTVEPRGAARGDTKYLQQRLPPSETRTALLGNYLLSSGLPGKVRDSPL
ncbi:hypothetical protein evm_014052 [Chilo suppressalis]|nr:hypothetical protein evm_014052 [Chilo suppressalis]